MDLIAELEARLGAVADHPAHEGFVAATRHIKVAVRRLGQGRADRDDDAYNDVVYRTNQAFEGMLKEAYAVLASTDTKSMTPAKLEQHFAKGDLFTPRVMDLFRNYRQDWRNPSTHDHRLIFRESEALLAIVSVSAFAAILLDQVVAHVSSQREAAVVAPRREQILKRMPTEPNADVYTRTRDLVFSFANEWARDKDRDISESQLMGRLIGFMSLLAPDLTIQQQPRLSNMPPLQPDLLVSSQAEKVLVELRRHGHQPEVVSQGHILLLGLMEASGLSKAILFVGSDVGETDIVTTTTGYDLQGRQVDIATVAPKRINDGKGAKSRF